MDLGVGIRILGKVTHAAARKRPNHRLGRKTLPSEWRFTENCGLQNALRSGGLAGFGNLQRRAGL